MSAIALWGTRHGLGPFSRPDPNESLLLLQAFMGTSAMIAMSVVAAVSEYRRTEVVRGEAQRQSQKMEVIGRFAGGIAHDFNNILTVIGGYSEMVMATGSLGGADRSAIEEIAQATRRASSLTTQLLAFSRQQLVQPIALDLNEVVSAIESMLRRLIGPDIVLSTVLAPSLGPVKSRSARLGLLPKRPSRHCARHRGISRQSAQRLRKLLDASATRRVPPRVPCHVGRDRYWGRNGWGNEGAHV